MSQCRIIGGISRPVYRCLVPFIGRPRHGPQVGTSNGGLQFSRTGNSHARKRANLVLAPVGRATPPGSAFAVCLLLEQVDCETSWQCQMIGCDAVAKTIFVLANHSTDPSQYPVEWQMRTTAMSKNQRQTPRKPATKFAHLQKKMQMQKVQVKKPTGRRK